MKYIDLHCDALTKEGVAVVTAPNLRAGGCALQCFAAFIRPGEGFSRALSLCEKFDEMCVREGFVPVRKASDFAAGKRCAMLAAEGGEAIEGSLEKLHALFVRGVRLMTLTWNFPNEIGFPNGSRGGLTRFGRECVGRMCGLGMIVDVSHGSDELVEDVAEICREKGVPFVASHSNARAVFSHPRNLSDGGIRAVAKSGGAIGLNFFDGFLSADKSAEGQRAALLAHAKHILNVGGEDVLALGSDFDGAPQNAYLRSPADVPKLLGDFERAFGGRIAEKAAFGNAVRVLKEVLR